MPERVPWTKMRLFCFPFAGGGASAYRPWIGDAKLGVVPVQLPGRENRMSEKPLCSMKDVVDQAARAITPYTLQPYAFFGHSLGARIAFEVVRELRRKGRSMPVRLFVSGSRTPEIREPRPLHQLDDIAFFDALARYGGTPQALLENRELMTLLLPMLRADFTVDETYDFCEEEPLSVPITAFYGAEDTEATREETEGWARHTLMGFEMKEMPGGHFYVSNESEALIAYIRSRLGL